MSGPKYITSFLKQKVSRINYSQDTFCRILLGALLNGEGFLSFSRLHQWALKIHLELSLLKSKGASVGVLSPMDMSASFSFELGTTLGIMR